MLRNVLILIILLIFGITLFLINNNSNSNIELTGKINTTDSIKLLNTTKKSVHKDIIYNNSRCISPLYVSDVLIDIQQAENQSLINLLKYFDKIGADIDQVKSILINSGQFTQKKIRNSFLLFSPPIYATTSIDVVALSANVNKIISFGKNYNELAEAVKGGLLNPRMNLSYFPGQFKSIIDYFLESRGKRPTKYFFKH